MDESESMIEQPAEEEKLSASALNHGNILKSLQKGIIKKRKKPSLKVMTEASKIRD